ncbi:hypothetical protein KXD93_10030 [Mucilaginibacter sp. BJC16-A38]|uniref:hypothetical protein n=1 Tax=Mucilaginibacter phenanthrenivorans TaxID=1234842 RepID=UPI00215850EC|nr:hypothetical protein [Mucilaginibacter phenanthrenivorans]MCR8557982.1 hypothetical protein [Mucilaginibacter phenanthrenivorans]MDP9081977.1 hypothetical protein [Bacteroidota bacterium]
METNVKIENQKREISQMKANSEDEYWAKKYDVSTEQLREDGKVTSIAEKILRATTKNKSFSF